MIRRKCLSLLHANDYIPGMNRSEVLSRIKRYRPEFEALGVEHLRVFGSVARGEASAASDVDVMATFRPRLRPGLNVIRLRRRLEEVLGRPVDLVRAPVKDRDLKRVIEDEGVNAF